MLYLVVVSLEGRAYCPWTGPSRGPYRPCRPGPREGPEGPGRGPSGPPGPCRSPKSVVGLPIMHLWRFAASLPEIRCFLGSQELK